MIELDRSSIDGIYKIVRLLDTGAARQISDAAYEAAKLVQSTARVMAPEQTGALRNSIRSQRRGGNARVIAGGTSRVPYAKVVHFGSPRRNIRPDKFMFRAADARFDQAASLFLVAVEEIWNEVMS